MLQWSYFGECRAGFRQTPRLRSHRRYRTISYYNMISKIVIRYWLIEMTERYHLIFRSLFDRVDSLEKGGGFASIPLWSNWRNRRNSRTTVLTAIQITATLIVNGCMQPFQLQVDIITLLLYWSFASLNISGNEVRQRLTVSRSTHDLRDPKMFEEENTGSDFKKIRKIREGVKRVVLFARSSREKERWFHR